MGGIKGEGGVGVGDIYNSTGSDCGVGLGDRLRLLCGMNGRPAEGNPGAVVLISAMYETRLLAR